MQHLFSTLRILLFKRILHPFSTSRLPACHGPFVRFEHDVLSSSAGTVGEHGVMKPTKSFGFFNSLAQHIGHRPSASPHHHQRRPSASTSTTHRPTPNAPSSQTKEKEKIYIRNGRELFQTVPEAGLFERVWPRGYRWPNLIKCEYVPCVSSLGHHTA